MSAFAAAPPQQTREGERRQQGNRNRHQASPHQEWIIGKGGAHDGDVECDRDGCGHRGEDHAVTSVRDGRRVIHDAVDRIANALIVEGRHRERLDALEELRAIVVLKAWVRRSVQQ